MDVECEKLIDKWVCEFVLRRQLNPRVCGKKLLSTLRLEEDDDCATLRKSAVLCDIWDRLIQGMVDEAILDLLELFEKLQLHEDSAILESLKSAYCWVAAECTVRYMLAVESTKGFLYLDALQRIWALRIGVLKERESHLVTQKLLDWGYNLNNAIEDPELYQRIRETNTRYTAVSYLCEFVREHWALVGSPSVELEAQRRFQGKGNVTNLEAEYGSDRENPDVVRNLENILRPSDFRDGVRHSEDDPVDDMNAQREVDVGEATGQQEQERQPSDDKGKATVAQELKECLLQIQALINSPIRAGNGQSSKNMVDPPVGVTLQPLQDNNSPIRAGNGQSSKNMVDPPVGVTLQPLQDSMVGIGGQDHDMVLQENVNEGASDGEATLSKRARPHLPSPQKLNVSPLRKGRLPQPRGRRLRRAWTPEEIQALRDGVKEYGKSWKNIKDGYPELFIHRTQVDLKDKWRNLTARER